MSDSPSNLITPSTLRDLLCPPADSSSVRVPASSVVVFDATVGAAPTDPHIPGAFLADIDADWSDADSVLPHTHPPRDQFESMLRSYGVNNDSVVVVYERTGLFSVARIWWLLRWAGLGEVFVLDGGLDAWQASGYPTTTRLSDLPQPGNVTVQVRADLLLDEDTVLNHVQAGDRRVLDARSRERFTGLACEPRPGLRVGHIPGSGNLPFTEVQQGGKLCERSKLAALLNPLIDDRPIITSCGSGVTACVLALALHEIGRTDVSVYDGSWAQWGRQDGPSCEC